MGAEAQLKDFFKDPFNRNLALALVALGAALMLFEPSSAPIPQNQSISSSQGGFHVDFFFLPTCPHCAEQKVLNQKLMQEFPQVKWNYIDASVPENAALMARMMAERGRGGERLGVPATFIGNEVIVGYESEETTGKEIREAISALVGSAKKDAEAENGRSTELSIPFLGKIDAKDYSLPVLAVVLGLVDGFNPCAMWVLVYLIALVMNLNDRKKIWFIVGSFVLASGILYFLFMTAWLNAFLMIGYVRIVTVLVGLIALGGGILAAREFITTKGEMECKIGDAEGKKKTMAQIEEIVSSPLTLATMAGIVVLAFVVNSVEFVCSSAIPAVFTQVLALSNLSFWEHYGYIALYVLFFMADDLVIFGLAAFAVSGGVGQRYAKYCKIIGGAILLVLGLILLFAPQMLR
ncbi:MAG: hypothetical protein N3F07_01940 [Candidatus Micrarchaeota archaeon]|nr:hypothetical protein [Candidatus Micrarchaeota archaeon]